MRIYFHSDDVCLTQSSTHKILNCWESGFLDGFSVLANPLLLPLVRESLSKNLTHPLRLSVHLNLTDFTSISDADQICLLVNKNGRFKVGFVKALFIHLFGGKQKKEFVQQVYKEWDAQIEVIKNELPQAKISGLDSHNYIHMIPSLYKVVCDLAYKHKIPFVRVPDEPFYIADWKDIFRSFYLKNILKFIVIKLLIAASGARKSIPQQKAMGILYSGFMFEKNVKAGIKQAMMDHLPSIELVFHVGRSEQDELISNINKAAAIDFFVSDNRDTELDTVKKMRNGS